MSVKSLSLSEARARRRLRCWLGLPESAELDPVVRRALSSCLSELWSPASGWSCPAWGREGAGWSSAFVEAVARSGLPGSAWWWVLPVDMLAALGGWSGCSSLSSSEEVSEAFMKSLSLWRSEELSSLVSSLSSSEELSSAGRAALSAAGRELERRGRRRACR